MADRSAQISVIIVNYNGAALIQDCLNGVKNQLLPPSEVILVDNASSDDSVQTAQKTHQGLGVIQNQENRYFAAAANQGIGASSGDFVLLLNNDCRLNADYLEILAAELEQDISLGAVVGKIVRTDGNTLDQAGQMLGRTRTPLDRGYGEQDDGEYDHAELVLSAGGVAPLMRRSMLDQVKTDTGWLDEDFIHFYEDLDLFWRAHNFGWQCRYQPAARATHHRGATSQNEPAVRSWVNKFAFANLPRLLQGHVLRNRYECMAKNDNFWAWLAALPFLLYYELKIMAYVLLVKPSLLGTWIGAWKGVGRGLRKRGALRKRATQLCSKAYGSIDLSGEREDD